MRCDEVQIILAELKGEAAPEDVRAHLASCAGCAEWARQWRRLSAGFRALAGEAAPEPSWGFSQRVVRRIEQATTGRKGAVEFVERAGRRVVWATLVVTLAVLLSLVLPSSGPVRAASDPDNLVPQSQVASAQTYLVIDVDSLDSPAPAQVRPGVESERK